MRVSWSSGCLDSPEDEGGRALRSHGGVGTSWVRCLMRVGGAGSGQVALSTVHACICRVYSSRGKINRAWAARGASETLFVGEAMPWELIVRATSKTVSS